MTDPVRYADLSARLKVILAGRGKTARFGTDLVVQDDGAGPWLRHWDEDALGPVPSIADVAAVTLTPATPVSEARRLVDRILSDPDALALLKAELVKD